jgi:hypothetical protein
MNRQLHATTYSTTGRRIDMVEVIIDVAWRTGQDAITLHIVSVAISREESAKDVSA